RIFSLQKRDLVRISANDRYADITRNIFARGAKCLESFPRIELADIKSNSLVRQTEPFACLVLRFGMREIFKGNGICRNMDAFFGVAFFPIEICAAFGDDDQ